jgi:sec-independent protein translocase protein TatC
MRIVAFPAPDLHSACWKEPNMPNAGSARERSDEDPDESGAMSFVEHLEELRKRIILAGIGVAAAVVVAAFFAERVFDFIFTPINAFLPPNGHFIYIRPGEGFSIYMQVMVMSGAILAAPWVLYQLWLFIAPGLYQREKRFAIPFVVLTTLGCVGGAMFSHFVAFRALMVFFGGFGTKTIVYTPTVESVFDLYVRLMIGLALVFQMPTIAFFLAKLGVVTARFLVSKLRHAVLILVIAAAVITPSTDPWNQMILAGTMIALYAVCILIVAICGRRPARDEALLLLCASASMLRGRVLPFERRPV